MNCSQCGAIIEEGLRFCPQCGARQQQLTFHEEEKKQKQGIHYFAEMLLAMITQPIDSVKRYYFELNRKMTLIYMGALILISACMSYLLFISLSNKVASLFYQVLDYFFGYGTIQYMLGQMNIQVLLIAALSNLLLVCYMTLLTMALYKIVLKIEIEWIECIQLMMMPILIVLLGKVVIFILGLLSIRIAIWLCFTLILLSGFLIVISFINRIGIGTVTTYTIPIIYIICSFSRWTIIFYILKGYL